MKDVREDHFVGKVAQKAIIVQDEKVLLVRDSRAKSEIWELPGGRLNSREEPVKGLIREIEEELGVLVDVHEVVYLEQFLHVSENKNALMIVYHATLHDPDVLFKLDPKEIIEAKFVSIEEALKLNLFPEYKRALTVYLAG